METIELIRKLLAWSTAINLGILVLASVTLVGARGALSRIHARMFGLTEEEVCRQYFQYLARYKAAFLFFNLVPYIAVMIIT